MKKIHLGKLLLDNHLISEKQLEVAIAEQKATGDRLGHIFVSLGFIKEDEMLKLVSEQLKIPFIDLKNYPLKGEVVERLPEFYARRYRAIVLKHDNEGILVGMVDPLDLVAVDEITRILQRTCSIALVREEDLLFAIDTMYRRTSEITTLTEELSEELQVHDYDLNELSVGLSSADVPVVRLIQTIFDDAVQVDASDIHIEPDETQLRIRLRIDGILHEQLYKEKQVASALALRLKLMAGLNIAEKRLPQDGRFSIKIKNKNFDVRLSTLPTQFGESVVMRLLNQSGVLLNLDQIGMPDILLERYRRLLLLPHGLILITGPTGSGKTTTLYASLNLLNSPENKIITVEDPVEYRLPRINQVQVQSKIELSFARVLKAMLRQDPDIIMVGEMRDKETVSIALRAAMTGHLVFATLHTNDAISSAVRLIDMGVEGFLVAAVLKAIIAQRLVRRICDNCKSPYSLTTQEEIWLKTIREHYAYSDTATFFHGTGCPYCHNTGYKGQMGVYELLELSAPLADALRKNDFSTFEKVSQQTDTYKPLACAGLDLALEGITTLSEVMRISGEVEGELISPMSETPNANV